MRRLLRPSLRASSPLPSPIQPEARYFQRNPTLPTRMRPRLQALSRDTCLACGCRRDPLADSHIPSPHPWLQLSTDGVVLRSFLSASSSSCTKDLRQVVSALSLSVSPASAVFSPICLFFSTLAVLLVAPSCKANMCLSWTTNDNQTK